MAISRRQNKNDLVSTLAHSDDAWVDNAHEREPLPFAAGFFRTKEGADKDAIFNEELYNPQPICNQRDVGDRGYTRASGQDRLLGGVILLESVLDAATSTMTTTMTMMATTMTMTMMLQISFCAR